MSVPHPLLTRRPARPARGLALLPGPDSPELPLCRVHEACGTARRTFAMWLAARVEGPVIWVAPAHIRDRLNADGIQDWTDPGRFLFVHPRRAEDVLWSMEEILRAGAVALAIADLPAPPGLTAVRRMHLAAETGAGNGPRQPLGVLLTPGTGGAAGVETRWQLSPAHHAGEEHWRLERLRARTAPQQSWSVTRRTGQPLAGIKTA